MQRVDQAIFPLMPDWMVSMDMGMRIFPQAPDEVVVELLQRAWEREAAQDRHPSSSPAP